jgi:hypothetical protein
MTNDITKEKNTVIKAYNMLLKENNDLKAEHEKDLRLVEINSQMKLSKLKKKMLDSVNETQSKAGELNSHYMDITSKLTVLQNHQFLIQLEYQEQELTKLISKNELLEKKVAYLRKEIEIHKEVEISLAEKNKKLTAELNKYKEEESENKTDDKTSQIGKSTFNFSQDKTQKLENKVIELEKKLCIKQKEYFEIKDKSDSFENILKNYEKKYTGLFKFFEECLEKFFNDEELKKNKDLYIDLDLMKKGDFINLNNKEKYSILIILMKYLMPLIYSKESLNEYNSLNNINLRFFSKKKIKISKISDNGAADNFLKKMINKNNNNSNISNNFCNNISNNNNNDLQYNSFDDLPKIKMKMKTMTKTPHNMSINIKKNPF